MRLTRLHVRDLRCLADVEIELHPRLNIVSGRNGAGKSSLLEAIHLLAYGRSFRGRVRDGLIRTGAPAIEVFVEWGTNRPGRPVAPACAMPAANGKPGWTGNRWTCSGTLCAALAVLTFEPGSHALVDGPGEARRRFLDWGCSTWNPASSRSGDGMRAR